MLASVAWLREICPVADDAQAIARALTSRGLTVDTSERRGEDTLLEIDVPANRPDCLGHLGLARELSAAFGVPLRPRPRPSHGVEPAVADSVRVTIDAPDLCRRYVARVVRGVRIAPSPEWVVRRLESCGVRAINNVVDASNLVLLETGNPIHFFDLQHVAGPAIVVRRAGTAERMTTLDGVERILDEEMLVIADDRRAVALAGVMGGADSEIGDATTDVLIEAAWFEPTSVRRTSRALGLATDASHRFGRGVDPAGAPGAADLAVRLLEDLAGGEPAAGAVDAGRLDLEPRRLTLRLSEVPRLLGYRPVDEELWAGLDALSLSPGPIVDGRIEVAVPSYRIDLEREADLVEEVARHLGYDAIPSSEVSLARPALTGPIGALEERARDVLSHLGMLEAFNYSMIGAHEDDPFVPPAMPAPLVLTNPIADTLSQLRRSLLPGLLRAVDLNVRRGALDVRLFEVGRVFVDRGGDGFPEEPCRVGLAWHGTARPAHWSEPVRPADLADLVGLVDALLGALAPGSRTSRRPSSLGGLHPGRSAEWVDERGRAIARGGSLHPRLGVDLPGELLLAEVDLGPLADQGTPRARFRPIPRLTAVTRDLALVVGPSTSWAGVREVLESVPAPAPADFAPVDRYIGPPLDDDQASLTVRLTLAPDARTLTEDEIEGYRLTLVAALHERLGIDLRG